MLYIHEVGMAFRIMVAKKWYLTLTPKKFDLEAQENYESLQVI